VSHGRLTGRPSTVTVSAAELGVRAELTGAVVTAVTAPTHGVTTAEMPQVHLG
jgi:hypothetical protein